MSSEDSARFPVWQEQYSKCITILTHEIDYADENLPGDEMDRDKVRHMNLLISDNLVLSTGHALARLHHDMLPDKQSSSILALYLAWLFYSIGDFLQLMDSELHPAIVKRYKSYRHWLIDLVDDLDQRDELTGGQRPTSLYEVLPDHIKQSYRDAVKRAIEQS